jgi:redox-sensing transcriptional repressor
MITTSSMHGIPEPTLRRLPNYCHYLRRLAQQGGETVSCTHIGLALNLDPTQVRKDLAVTGIVGRPKVGYHVQELYARIEDFLGWNNTQDAVLVGAGSLGTALLGYKSFDQNGVRIVAAFDVNPEKADTQIHGTPVFHLDKLPNLLDRMKIRVGILTLPADTAQTVCDLLVLCGVRAIWNFAPTALIVPDGVIVQNENLFSSLAILSSKLAGLLRGQEINAVDEES